MTDHQACDCCQELKKLLILTCKVHSYLLINFVNLSVPKLLTYYHKQSYSVMYFISKYITHNTVSKNLFYDNLSAQQFICK